MIDVSDSDCGVWVDYTKLTPIQFDVAVVEVAIRYGYEVLLDVWNADKPKFLGGIADEEMLDELYILADFSIQYLNEQLPKNYFFDISKLGLVLTKNLDISEL